MTVEEQVDALATALENVHPSNGVFVRRDKVVAALRAIVPDRISGIAKTGEQA